MNKCIKILLLDDDEVDRLHLRRALKSCDFTYELTECESAANVLELTSSNSFDCIFLDYLLPGENGLQLLRKLREAGTKTPVVITTSHGSESIAVELMKSGASDYLIKNQISGYVLGQILRNIIKMSEVEREREEAVKALRISESRLAEAQQIAGLGNWEYNIMSDSLFWSTEVFKIFELNPNEPTPSFSEFLRYIPSEDKPAVQTEIHKAIKGEPFNCDFRISVSSGIKYVNSQGYVLKETDRIPKKVVGTLQDITERKLVEKAIQEAKELAENSMKVREIFLANMSHEIRTPMNAILGFTRLLYETELSKEQKSFIDAIHFSGENLLVIINDILDLSKMKSGKLAIENCDFNLLELINGIVSILKPKAVEKGLQLSYKLNDTVPVSLKGDPVRLNQVLTNLITNAIKFTEKGGVYLNIDASGQEEKEFMIEFKIRDTGIGIPLEMQSTIFENFVQASSDTTRKYGGTGLGLTIVKNLVELQNGKIMLTSSPGNGTTFIVHLPFENAEQNSSIEKKRVSGMPISFSLLQGKRILVAEDNGVNQLLIKKVLEKAGCIIDIASNGHEATEILKLGQHDLVLMDIQMPEMDGYEATRIIRNSKSAYAEIPIIALTAHAFGSDVNKSVAAGMNDHVSKPFSPETLYSKMCEFMTKSSNTKIINEPSGKAVSIDLSPIYELGNGDIGFLNELIVLYDQQTPVFIERLRGYLKSQNFGAMRSICHQIKSSYGIVQMVELDKALETLSSLFKSEKPENSIEEITRHTNILVSLIAAITEEIKRNLRKAS